MQGRFFAARRALLGSAALLALPLTAALGAPKRGRATSAEFDAFLDSVRADGRRAGISPSTLNRALAGLRPNPRVLELDRFQPEGPGMTWEEYREKIVSPTRVENGRRAFAESRRLLDEVSARYRVSPRVIVAIWGMETNYGTNTGGFGVIEALATLAWDGRRSAYFRSELLAALRVLDGGHIPPERMRGSWAGAMGQPQFMPSNFERLAVDFDGDGRRDIWDSRADALASIAHYLSRHGWREGEPWGLEVLPPGPVGNHDADAKRPLRDWARLGFRRVDGGALPGGEVEMGLVQPNRSAGTVFLGGHNLRVIRRYNPPINYGLAVGLLSDRVA
jgi:membrane-bound lytic murein transglycosylase B